MTLSMVEIAKRARVSVATVSRVMNKKGGYGKATGEKVEAIIKESGYQKNEMASGLKRSFTRSIGVVIPTVVTNYFGLIVEGIEEEARKNGYSILLAHSGDGGEHFEHALTTLTERRVSGLIFVSVQASPEEYQLVKQTNVAHIFISSDSETQDFPKIKIDDYQASLEATRYLIAKGHKKIGLVGLNPTDKVAGEPRIKGYKEAFKEVELELKEEWVIPGDFGVVTAEKGVLETLDEIAVTALFCASDEAAIGAMKACRKKGINVPEDMSIMGFDDSATAKLCYPELTTVHQPLFEMGRQSIYKLIQVIENNDVIESEIVPFDIIERESVVSLT